MKRQNTVSLLLSDQHRSVLMQSHSIALHSFTPFGFRPAQTGVSLAFNGELCEGNQPLYLLGHGYRAYAPTLMRFRSPDAFSPFGRGGMNCYAYVLGDPINRVDPSGHMPVSGMVGKGLGKLGQQASKPLGASVGLGLSPSDLHLVTKLDDLARTAIQREINGRRLLAKAIKNTSTGEFAAKRSRQIDQYTIPGSASSPTPADDYVESLKTYEGSPLAYLIEATESNLQPRLQTFAKQTISELYALPPPAGSSFLGPRPSDPFSLMLDARRLNHHRTALQNQQLRLS